MSERRSTCCAPPGPVQSPGSTMRSSMRTPSDVVVPTRFPAPTRMCVISRVTVDLPFVPEIEIAGTLPVRVTDPRWRRRPRGLDLLGPAREGALLGAGEPRGARRRHVPFSQGQRRVRQRPCPLLAEPRERDDPVTRVRRAMDGESAAPFAVVGTQAPDPGGDRRDRIGPVVGRDGGAEADDGVPAGVALAVPGAPPTEGQLHFDHRLEPVDVRPLQQTDLDQAHGPGRIATRDGRS